MNIKSKLSTFTVASLLALTSACSKNDTSTAPSTTPAANVAPAPAPAPGPVADQPVPAPVATDAAAQVTNTAQPVVDQAKAAATVATEQAQSTAQAVTQQGAAATASVAGSAPAASAAASAPLAAETSNKVQAVVTQAKDYVAQNKYQLALTSLQKLDGMKLSPREQSVVDSLKTQVQKKMASDATKSVTDFLNK